MSRQRNPLVIYHQQELMNDYNDLQVRIKTHLFNLGDDKFKETHPKPTNEEIDNMMHRVMEILKQDHTPAVTAGRRVFCGRCQMYIPCKCVM